MVNAAKVLQDLRASAERKPDVVVRLGKPLVESGAVMKLDADGNKQKPLGYSQEPTILQVRNSKHLEDSLGYWSLEDPEFFFFVIMEDPGVGQGILPTGRHQCTGD